MGTEVMKLLYIVVEDDDEDERKEGLSSFRYARPVLQSTLQLMGCKARHAFKISQRVFELMRSECFKHASKVYPLKETNSDTDFDLKIDGKSKTKPFESYKRRTMVVVRRKTFLDVVCEALAEYKYVCPNQRGDLVLACRIREWKESVTVLFCGTSGCGKSTLSALLGGRLGITTVISTDSIRHMMRSFVSEKQNPLLWASTYHAGEYLDPVAVAKAKAKRKAKKLALSPEEVSSTAELINPKQMAIEGFKAQSEMVIDSLDRLITGWEERKESVVVEGVHLSLNFVMGLMKKHPSIIPFMIYIANEDKHLERFAVRAKYMTLDPEKNKYVKYIRNIRTIQEYLRNRAQKHLVPKVNNTNVDKSVAVIHATVFSCLRRREGGDSLYDYITNTVSVIDEEYNNQCVANSLSSKGMYQLIQRKGSSRSLMALLNTDGSVAKAWPVNNSVDSSTENGIGFGVPMYGPLQIGKAEPVNLQFGNFGISAWHDDACGTSHASSLDESRGDGTDNGSRYHSSCCSSPRNTFKPAKELKETHSVYGSDEENYETAEIDSDEDLSNDDRKHNQEEIEGSVDEESTKSDEEYDDLAMQDIQENDYWSDNYENYEDAPALVFANQSLAHGLSNICQDKYEQNLDRFMRTKSESESMRKNLLLSTGTTRVRRRSYSISSFGNDGLFLNGPLLSGAEQIERCGNVVI